MHRNTPCCNGKGYLAQRKEDLGWGVCLTYRTKAQCTNAPKQVGSGSLIDLARGGGTLPQGAGTGSLIDLARRGAPLPGDTTPKSPPPGSTNPASGCGNCNPLDMGCAIGKQFCEFQAWLAKSVGGLGVPVMVGGGLVILLLMLKR